MDKLTVVPPSDLVELAAGYEALKQMVIVAFGSSIIVSGVGSQTGGLRNLQDEMLSSLENADIRLPDPEARRFRDYAQATLLELVGRVRIGDVEVNPKS